MIKWIQVFRNFCLCNKNQKLKWVLCRNTFSNNYSFECSRHTWSWAVPHIHSGWFSQARSDWTGASVNCHRQVSPKMFYGVQFRVWFLVWHQLWIIINTGVCLSKSCSINWICHRCTLVKFSRNLKIIKATTIYYRALAKCLNNQLNERFQFLIYNKFAKDK